jgi:hypothetical protein
MTAWIVHRFAELLGLPGEAVGLLAIELQSEPLMHVALALKAPSFHLHLFALDHLQAG